MYQKTVLPNKLRIITHPMKERDSVSVGLLIGTGGRYENDQNKGAAHFLEHILFKGSKNYACEEIKELIEGVGGSLNAFTSEESTCYFAKIPSKYLNRTFDILADIVFHPLINKKDVDKERTVILEEIKMYHDVPQYFVLELLDELMWPNHPLGKNLAGSFESVGGMTPVDLKQFHQHYYFPGNIVIGACGALEHKDFIHLAQKKLSGVNFSQEMNFLPAQDNQKTAQIKFF
ncbi:MAG TPA: pitrilysin family protein, partial [Candidatus Omnitrophota bacterium]|nr:pitrilysin family protein [Candidatus Omnitrophota bacterium]